MNGSLVSSLVILAAVAGVLEWRRWHRLNRGLRAIESAYDAEFDLTAWRDRLDGYVDVLRSILPPAAMAAPPITEVSFAAMHCLEMARSAVDEAARRFGLALPVYAIELTSDMPSSCDGQVVWEVPWDVRLSGDQLIVEPAPDRDPDWRVRLRDGLQHDPERLAVVAAHEVAHIVLLARKVRVQPESENELLTDAAAVLAGFGPLMERTAFALKTNSMRGRKRRWYFTQSGYLHRSAVRYLQARRDSLAPDAGNVVLSSPPPSTSADVGEGAGRIFAERPHAAQRVTIDVPRGWRIEYQEWYDGEMTDPELEQDLLLAIHAQRDRVLDASWYHGDRDSACYRVTVWAGSEPGKFLHVSEHETSAAALGTVEHLLATIATGHL